MPCERALEAFFLRSAQELAQDTLFGTPAAVLQALAGSSRPQMVILGTRGLATHLIDARRHERYDIVAVVDDTLRQTQSHYEMVPLITTARFVELCRGRTDMVAINTCGRDRPRRFFAETCRAHRIPCMNFEQALRAFQLQGLVDHRLDDWGPHIAAHVAHYQALAQAMGDSYSVQTLYAILNFQLTCDPAHFHEIERPYASLYFRSGLLSFGHGEKMVDCGASVGESLLGLMDVAQGDFAHSWLIEPDRFNIQTLQALRERSVPTGLASRISIHGCAVGASDGRVAFQHQGGPGSSVQSPDTLVDEADTVALRTIDGLIDDAPTFIKMDVEGSELSALQGARSTIADHGPKLAISAYHRPTDLLELSSYVLSLRPGYRMGLRHHGHYRWDTCLYFYP